MPPSRINTGGLPQARSIASRGELRAPGARVEQRRVRQLELDRHLGAGRRRRAQQPLQLAADLARRSARPRAARSRGRAPAPGRSCAAPPPSILFTSSAGRGPGALVELRAGAGSDRPRAHRRQHLVARRQPLPGLALLGAGGVTPAPAPRARARRRPARPRRACQQHVRRVQHRAAVEARVQVALARAHLDVGPPGRAWPPRSPACARRPSASRTRARSRPRARPRAIQRSTERAADLLLALHQEAHVHRQLARARELAGHVQQRQEVALVVGGAARVEAAVALGRLERRAVPGVERPRRPARRSGRRRAPSGRPARAARSSPTAIGWPPSTVTASASPPAASIRSQTHSQARASAPRRRPRRWTRRGCAASRRARRSIVGTRRILPHRVALSHAPPVPARRGGGAGGHDVLRRGRTAAAALRDELGLSKSAAGVLAAAYPAGTLVGALPAGWLAARWGVKPTLLLGPGAARRHEPGLRLRREHRRCSTPRASRRASAAPARGRPGWPGSCRPRRPERRGELIGSALGAAIVGVLLGPVLGGAATLLSPELVFSGVAVVAAGLAAWAWTMPGVAAGARARAARAGPRAAAAGGARGLLAVHPARDLRRRDRGARRRCGWTSWARAAPRSARSSS